MRGRARVSLTERLAIVCGDWLIWLRLGCGVRTMTNLFPGHGVGRWRRCLRVAMAILVVLAASGVRAQPSDGPGVDQAAHQIAEALFQSIRENGNLRALDGVVMAQPIAPEDLPVPPAEVLRLDSAVVTAFARQTYGMVDALIGADLADRITELYERFSGPRFQDESKRLLAASRPALVLKGAIVRAPDGVRARYRLVTQATPPRTLGDSGEHPVALADEPPATTVDGAMRAAARRLSGQLGVIETVFRHGGFAFEETGRRTRLGRYLEDRLLDALTADQASPVHGRTLRIRPIELDPAALPGVVGHGGTVEQAVLTGPRDVVLSGTFWPRGDETVEVAITLTGRDGATARSRRLIRTASLPSPPTAPGVFDLLAGDRAGGFGLRVISRRGRDPTYRVGELFSFGVGLDRSADVYCFDMDEASGQIVKLFPNRYHPSARLHGGRMLTLPDDLPPYRTPDGREGPIEYPVMAPPAAQLVKCFALAPDGAARLPAAVTDTPGGGPVTFIGLSDRALLAAFRIAGGAALSEASMVVNVVE